MLRYRLSFCCSSHLSVVFIGTYYHAGFLIGINRIIIQGLCKIIYGASDMSRFLPLSALFVLLFCVAPHATAADAVRVRMQTNFGPIMLELYPDKAPQTVANFLRYVDSGFYEKVIFHRVIPGFMIQGGGLDLAYNQKPTRAPVPNEADNGLKNLRGTIAMARTGDPHSATSQFFINVVDNAFLDYQSHDFQGWGYCVFGKVIEGMNIADEIAKAATGPGDVPQSLIVIDSVKRVATPKKALKAEAKPQPAPAPVPAPEQTTPAKEASPKSESTTKEAP
jgi:cyclophilin family peptidyl-prolyl cis-trans isomerase